MHSFFRCCLLCCGSEIPTFDASAAVSFGAGDSGFTFGSDALAPAPVPAPAQSPAPSPSPSPSPAPSAVVVAPSSTKSEAALSPQSRTGRELQRWVRPPRVL